MWRTSNGTRTLKGAEARVLANVLWSLLDEVMPGMLDEWDYGVQCSDSLTPGVVSIT